MATQDDVRSDLLELAERLSGQLYKLLLSATSVDRELRNEVDDRFKDLTAALRARAHLPTTEDDNG